MPIVKIPFVGGAYKGRSINQNPQECVNFFLETDQEGGKEPIALYGTPGCLLYLDSKLWVPGGVTPVPTPTPVPGTRYEFLDSSQTIIKDNWTGLMWQATKHKEQLYYDGAVAYCNELVLGDFSDWRLPTRSELVNLCDYAEYRPSLPSIFTDVSSTTGPQSFASITSGAHFPGTHWDVNFTLGTSYCYANTSDFNWIRAVRGPQRPAAASRLAVNAANTVKDTYTGLIWQKDHGGAMTLATALTYADALSLDGYTDWRLPTIYELESIVDYTQYYPSIGALFTSTAQANYWTSTVYANPAVSNNYWVISFSTGIIERLHQSDPTVNIRAVRDAE